MPELHVTNDEVVEAVGSERDRLLAAINALGDSASTVAVTPEGWTSRDVLAHLIHYAGQIAFALGAQLQPPGYVLNVQGKPTGDEWNALAVEHYRHQPLADVRDEFERLVALIIERSLLRSDVEMNAIGAIPWAGDVPLWQFIAGDTYLHWPAHTEMIGRAR